MIPHVLLSDNTLTLILPTQTTTITPYRLNYWDIRKHLDTLSPEHVSALLSEPTPELGVYHFYADSNAVYAVHCAIDATTSASVNTILTRIQGSWALASLPKSAIHLGVFKSFNEMYATFPEFFI